MGKRPLFFLGCFLALLQLSAAGISQIEPVPETIVGLRCGENGKWRFLAPFQPDSEGRIIAPAADPDRFIAAPVENSWFADDPEFGGKVLYQGSYNRNLAAFDFELTAPGTYRPYFLVRATNPAALHFTMEFNRVEGRKEAFAYSIGQQNFLVRTTRGKLQGKNSLPFDEKAYRSMKYFWMPGEPVKLEPGIHTLRLRNGFYYMNLAAAAIVGNGRKLPLRPQFSRRKAVSRAKIFYHAFNGQLLDLALKKPDPGVQLYVSVNDQPFYPAEWKKYLSVSGRIRICAGITQNPQNSTLPEITAKIRPVKRMVLENRDQILSFDPEHGTLNSWQVRNGPQIIPPEIPQKLYSMSVSNAQRTAWKNLSQPDRVIKAEIKKDAGFTRFILTSRPAPDITAEITVSLPAESGPPLWELKLNNQSANEIRDIDFPQFRQIRLGQDAENIRLTRTADMTGFNHPGALIGFATRTFGTHPGFQTMGYLAFHTPGLGSFTLQRRMADGFGVRFSMTLNRNGTGADISTNRRYAVEPGKTASVSYLAGFLRGDEYDCCDLYGKWARSWMDFSRVNTPYTRNIHTMGRSRLYPIGRTAVQQLPFLRWMGVNCIWELGGRLVYTPCTQPRAGTPAELSAEKKILRDSGIQTYVYFDVLGTSEDYALWDHIAGFPKSDLSDPLLLKPGDTAKGGVRMRNGKLVPWGWAKNHASQDNCMCIDDDLWSDYITKAIIREHYGKYGYSVYTDECNFYMECYNRRHRHGAQYGSRMVGTAALYERIFKELRGKAPWFSFFGEGAVDFLTQYNEFVIRNGMDCVDGATLMFALPEVKIMRGCANAFTDGAPDWEDALREYHLFARNLTSAEIANNTREFNLHRSRIMDWMYDAEFRDSAGMSFSRPGVRGKYFIRNRKNHRGIVMNFHNPFQRENISCRLDLNRLPAEIRNHLPKAAVCYDMEGESLSVIPVAREGQYLTLKAPSAKASSLIIAAAAPQKELLRTALVWPQTKGPDHLMVYFCNPGSKPMTVSAALRLPAPLTAEPLPKKIVVPPQTGKSFRLKLMNRSKLQDFASAELLVNRTSAVKTLIAPELCNRDFEIHPAKDLRPNHWGVIDYYYELAYKQSKDSPVDPKFVSGILDPDRPHSGKYSMRLPGCTKPLAVPQKYPSMGGPYFTKYGWPAKPIALPWYYNAGQYAILKPGTEYELTFAVRFASDDGCLRLQAYPYTERRDVKSYLFATREIRPEAGNRNWKIHTVRMKTPDTHLNNYKTSIFFVNRAPAPCWIDSVSIREVSR